ncbi:hypothetical protein Patl1_27734 [Pistacia atlantica]|uniref:Uncharacterized protein n=1 Tax=Pistacia atlantica TaxID=434234 RepID=A0ACC1BEU1_9ROSI|nr:hypothetical protein Patl1_27734 [Pistacia atlantica]
MSGIAKVVGTVVSIFGAMVLILYKGMEIIWSTNINLIQNNTNHAKMVKKYPCKYSSTALRCTAAAIQATIYALFTETDPSKWKLGWNIRLLSAVYTGAVATGLMVVVMAWAFEILETDNMTQSGDDDDDDDQVITCSSVFVFHNAQGIEDRTSFEASIVAENQKYLEVRFNCSISLDRGAMIS